MNPVYSAEVRYQDYVLRTNRSSNIAIAMALLLIIPALIMALVATAAVGIFNVDLPPVPVVVQIQTPLDVLYTIGAVTLLTMNLAHYLVVALISSGLAVFSIQREQRNHTWELLVLTRLSAQQIAFGKIRASLWVLRRDTAIITTLRVGLVSFALDVVRPVYPDASHNVAQFAIIMLLVVAWTVLDMVLAVSTSVASTLLPRGRAALMPLALVARAITLFGGVWWLSRIVDALFQDPGSPRYVLIGAFGVLVFALMAAVSLKIAEFSAQIAHASPSKISQAISHGPQSRQGQHLKNIPTLSQG